MKNTITIPPLSQERHGIRIGRPQAHLHAYGAIPYFCMDDFAFGAQEDKLTGYSVFLVALPLSSTSCVRRLGLGSAAHAAADSAAHAAADSAAGDSAWTVDAASAPAWTVDVDAASARAWTVDAASGPA